MKDMYRLAAAVVVGTALVLGLLVALPGRAALGLGRATAGVRYVDVATGTDAGNDCSNPAQPCKSIQRGVDQADEGDEILVAEGTYTEAAGAWVVDVDKTVTIRGGYPSGVWSGPDTDDHPTVVDGQGVRRVFRVDGTMSPTLALSPTIEGLWIVNGKWALGAGVFIQRAGATLLGNRIEDNEAAEVHFDPVLGGGIYVGDAQGVTLKDNVIRDNQAGGLTCRGGGLYVLRSELTLVGNDFESNRGLVLCVGGGIYMRDSTAQLRDNRLVSNAGFWGGGLYVDGGGGEMSGMLVERNNATMGGGAYLEDTEVTIERSVFFDNFAFDDGGAFYVDGGAPALVNNMVVENVAEREGAGLYVVGAAPRLLHATLARNTGGDGSGLFLTDGSSAVLTNTILVSHTVGFTVSGDSQAKLTATLWGTGTWGNETDWGGDGSILTGTLASNLWGDPAFVEPDAGDYHIRQSSAAVDQVSETVVEWDVDGHPRPIGPYSDLGADEWAWHTHLPLVAIEH